MIRFRKIIVFFVLFIISMFVGYSQGEFKIHNNEIKQTLRFKLVNNLIILPMEVNGKKLNFILDTGVNTTILFNLVFKDSLELRNIEKIELRGLGSGKSVNALLSKGNDFKTGKVIGNNQKLYLILNERFDLSAKLGITIHGIIGYDIFKDFVVEINYVTEKITFYNPERYKAKTCRKCETFPLTFHKKKPYVDASVMLSLSDAPIPVKLLIDSGGSDALWLFDNKKKGIVLPKEYFDDFIGEGLSGNVYGKRSKIHSFSLGKFKFKEPKAAFPDSISTAYARLFKARNGSLGGEMLKRFKVVFDYRNNKMVLRKNNKFNDKFEYNLSGLELVYGGSVIVKEIETNSFKLETSNGRGSDSNKIVFQYNYKYKFKPAYKISDVRKGSPAEVAGVMKNDRLLRVNGKETYKLELQEIIAMFYKENKRITLVVERNGIPMRFEFELKKIF